MKNRADLTRGWLRKARSDVIAVDACLSAGALDSACFHAQQAAEKYLKAFLTHSGIKFPFTHNLSKLVELCSGLDSSFQTVAPVVIALTPYAVELRYDDEFWPTREVAEQARLSMLAVRDFILPRLPGYAPTLFD